MLFEFNLEQVSLFVRLRGTVLQRIQVNLVLYILYVTTIVALHVYVHALGLFSSIVGVLGIIISLLLGFRTNSAHSKYAEGRRVWGSIKNTVRTMSRTIWIVVPSKTTKDLIMKKSAINLLDAFCHSLKHYLREEYSDKEKDIEPFVRQIQKFELRPEKLPKHPMMSHMDPNLACSFLPPTNIPNEIIYQLTLFSRATLQQYPNIHPLIWGGVNKGILALEQSLSELEALRRTPIPVCYSAHLTHAIWIYLLFMPFQILNTGGWWVIPTLAITFFAFEGCIKISKEMEDPFGYDANDLPLGMFCWTIRKELAQITAILQPDFEYWSCADENFPLAPYDNQLSAQEWSSKSLEEARDILLNLNFETEPKHHTREEWKKFAQELDTQPIQNGPANV